MDYKTLVAKVADSSGVSRTTAGKVMAAVRDTVVSEIKNGENVKFSGLGSFKMIQYKATHRRDPISKEIRSIPARMKPKFVFSTIAEEELAGRR